ncbi:hypothetical protein A2615_04960 [Candidatus Curtissbacteria bacterium RIFOXYD1_FULL_41_36]|uniref:SLC41A/MgtE integral membrane domain-containing protein n=1 Tax=Candidatus Curtissbacteria bacterium RIFOXYA1_FULL_41_14 TaxID=1797737 RepID=A0A1F5HAZ9_9BACT|nr:MAG: CBS domain containing protein [Microgenomates group bacterium GW2011_GWC1_40_35]KKR75820.1 MAG: CBS domain containing protein [Candidatus Curtissbacteria bacterium GW2011_GWD1_40_8]KKS02086.1 MAG: CBS domain containing protein [Candidatus Curtissbacteria bacterium GW2011_GWC2_41_21]OGE01354.1 MAG: hypothetical protein A2196_04355 [Candidatus Curtissbacteria bacterium RIFOXYA1_FULL_41_14]OGE08338.1 MAG: hypothetical protein A2615_04960 [Candidatus Curtissbacteria bacterium RIFOXYD1_FULL_
MNSPKHFAITDDVHQRTIILARLRLPWLIVGLTGGLAASFLVSKFEDVLAANLYLVFFIPVIVYLSDAVGTQTEVIYVRNLSTFKDNFAKYLAKEILVGGFLGAVLGVLLGLAAFAWLRSVETAITVGFAMFLNTTIAPVIAVVIPEILSKENIDPALGGGPFTTVIQDFVSLLIYFLVATAIIL